jgi:transcriptional regulator with XRE-family HTH domain
VEEVAVLLRDALGETLRDARTRQNRTLRDVSTAANVSLGYLSEVERGRKEASSELLASICDALDVELADVLTNVSQTMQNELAHHNVARTAATDGPAGTEAAKNSAKEQRGLHESGGATAGKASTTKNSATSFNSSLRIVLPYERTKNLPVS